jgi:hypothetical protein
MKLRGEEGKDERIELIGYTQILDSGYDEEIDLYFIALNKLDEDLNTVIQKTAFGKLQLQSVMNLGLILVRY